MESRKREIKTGLFLKIRMTSLILGLFLMVLSFSTYAVDTIWNGGSNDWNTPGNWSAGVPTAADTAIFNGTGSLTPTLTGIGGIGTANILRFDSGLYTINTGANL